jgi:hypothetical protein
MRPAMRAAVRLLTLLGLLAGEAAASDRPRVAILEVALGGDAAPALRARIEKSLDGGLYAAGYEVIPEREVAAKLRRARSLAGCTSTTCLLRIGDLVGAQRFVRARVRAAAGAYDVELELLAADAEGGLVRRLERGCQACNAREANDLVSRAVVELMTPPAPEPPRPVRVAVTSRPAGAEVKVDGQVVGVSPVEVEVAPGEHAFEAGGVAGHGVATRQVAVEGQAAEVLLELVPVAPAPRDEPRGARFGSWKWAAAGGAVAAVGAGVTLLALDGQETDCLAGQPCRSEYDTLAGGLALTAVGVGLGALATWMFIADQPVVVAPRNGGVAVVVVGSF